VETREEFTRDLHESHPDLIICDFSMPQFDGLTALQITLEYDPLIPLIIYTGSVNEETAVQCMKAGAVDYILKDRTARLGPAAVTALQHARDRREHILDQKRLVESEWKYREMVETSYEGIWRVDKDFRISFVNSRICEMLGYEQNEMLGREIKSLIFPEEWTDYDIRVERFLQGEHQRFERRLLRRDGRILTVYASVSPIFTPEGEFAGSFAMHTDLTDRLRSEELRLEMEKQTERSLRLASIGTLAAGISHEINQPLTVIKSEVDGYLISRMMNYELSSDDVRDIFQTVSEQVGRINSIIQHMRTMVREPHETRQEPTPIGEVMRSALFFLTQQCRNHGIDIEYIPVSESLRIMANPLALEQAIVNVLQNAIQALDSTTVSDKRITIWIETGNGQLVIDIRNNGPQIAEEDLPKIFDPFFTTKSKQANMGLGLSIVANFVQAMSGTVTCENIDPTGVAMRITFPVESV
jgi:PAS domain S-box-containing protein